MKFILVFFSILLSYSAYADNHNCNVENMYERDVSRLQRAENAVCNNGQNAVYDTLHLFRWLDSDKASYIGGLLGLSTPNEFTALLLSGFQVKYTLKYVEDGQRFMSVYMEAQDKTKPLWRASARYSLSDSVPPFDFQHIVE